MVVPWTGASFDCRTEPPAEVSKYDPVDLEELERTELDTDSPGHIALGEGAAWTFDGFNVVALDLRSGKIRGSLLPLSADASRELIGGDEVAAGFGSVWLASGAKIFRIDAARRRVTDSSRGTEADELDLAVSADRLWTAVKNGRTITRLSPGDLRVIARLRLPRGVKRGGGQRTRGEGGLSLAGDDHALWAADSQRMSVVKIDGRSLRVLRETRLPATPLDAALGNGALWVATDRGQVVEIDPRTGRIRNRFDTGIYISHLAVGPRGVYATGYDDDALIKLDPSTGDVQSTKIEGPSGLAAGPGGVWVTRE